VPIANRSDVASTPNGASVSVIIPAYNRRQIVGRAIQSVLNQTFLPKEVFIIDDGSNDGTPDFVAEMFPQVTLLRRGTNQGAAAARNLGLTMASGDFIAFLDSDDFWMPTYLEKQITALAGSSSAAFGYCGRYQIANDKRSVMCCPIDPDNLLKSMLMDCFVHTMSQVVIPRKVLERVGKHFDERLSTCEDWELYLRLLTVGEAVRVDEELLVKHWLPDSYAFRNGGENWAQGCFGTLDIFYSRPESAPYADLRPILEERLRRELASHLAIFERGVLRKTS
jgi:glycosyltransferase involved in cell wall biosynthesis